MSLCYLYYLFQTSIFFKKHLDVNKLKYINIYMREIKVFIYIYIYIREREREMIKLL